MIGNVSQVVVNVKWERVLERIFLDFDSAGNCVGVSSSEKWGGDVGTVCYRPGLVKSSKEGDLYSIELEYLENDHGYLFKGDRGREIRKQVLWGRTSLCFFFDGENATIEIDGVKWIGDGNYDRALDGSPIHAKIWRDKSPELKKASNMVRLEQRKFKSELCEIKFPPSCAITGETTKELLDAAHIVAVADGGSSGIENGLLLRADIHRLYDANFFEIDEDGKIVILKKPLPGDYKNLLNGKEVSEEDLNRIIIFLKKRKNLEKMES